MACPGVNAASTETGKALGCSLVLKGTARLPEAMRLAIAECLASIVVIDPTSCCNPVSVSEFETPI